MADVAKEIYLHRIYRYGSDMGPKERGANLELALNYAESLCRCGKVREALEVYENCAKSAEVSIERLKPLATSILESVLAATSPPPNRTCSVFVCAVCEGVLVQPCTLPCGHTFCRRCVVRDCARGCRRCDGRCTPYGVETDILVSDLVEKLWPVELEAARLREEGNLLYLRNDLHAALIKYNESLTLVPDNHLALSNRSHALYLLGRTEGALADAEQVVKLRPYWGKGHYRRATALVALSQYEAALTSFCICAALERNVQALRQDVAKVLQHMLSKQRRLRHKSKSSPFSTPTPKSLRRARYFQCPSLSNSCSDGEQSSGEEDFLPSTCVDLPLLLNSVLREVDHQRIFESQSDELVIDPNLVKRTDFDCVLCCRTLWRPVTTPCGHTYCLDCLDRCLDYSSSCPLCVKSLAHYLVVTPKNVNIFLEECLNSLLSEECNTRRMLHAAEVAELSAVSDHAERRIPIFVCTTAFPTVHCPLFIYEPRYRLMVRRCVEAGTRQFGIAACLTSENGARRYADFGTMLEIRDRVLLSDGSSILSTIGVRRFRTRSRGERDGYATACVEFISDVPVSAELLPALEDLHCRVRSSAQAWVNTLSPDFLEQIYSSFGEMPQLEDDWSTLQDGPSWAWWLLAILPLGPQLQISILGTTSLDKRLRAIEKTLLHITKKVPVLPTSTKKSIHTISNGNP